MRNDSNIERDDHNADHANICADRTALSGVISANASCCFDRRDHGVMEPCNDLHGDCGNNNIYVHTKCGTVRNNNNTEHYDLYPDHADLCADWPAVSEFHTTCFAPYFFKWHNGDMESCDSQHSNGGDTSIYIYARCGTVRYDRYIRYYSDQSDHTDFCTDRSTVSKLYATTVAKCVTEWYHR